MWWTLLMLLLVAALAGCAVDSGQAPAPVASPSSPATTPGAASGGATPGAAPSDAMPGAASGDATSRAAPSEPAGTSITGVLGGDAQLEGGCAWIDTDEGRIEPLWPRGYTVTLEPLALIDPGGETVAEEGDRITVTGAPSPDTATICQVGEVWKLTGVAAADRR